MSSQNTSDHLKTKQQSKPSSSLSTYKTIKHQLSDSEDDVDEQETLHQSKLALKDTRPPCKYGEKCYRKNPDHLKTFSHKRSNVENASTVESSSKKLKLNLETSIIEKLRSEYHFYVTKVQGIANKYNENIALGIKDLLSPSQGKLVASAQFNYMVDVEWLMEQYPKEFRGCPLTIVHGEQHQSKHALEASGAAFKNIKFCQAKLSIPFGTHHTKMMLLLYETGLKVVIHTSNLVPSDWSQKTQGMWVSPLFPRLGGEPSISQGDSITKFKTDLIEYVSSYNAKELEEWCSTLKRHDMSKAKVFIIGSIPGRHIASQKTKFGHLKLRKTLNMYGPISSSVTNHWPIIGQFSSIGSLGASPHNWLQSEWLSSFSTVRGKVTESPPLKLVYPSVENVRKSLEGYPAGASLPYSIKVASKQPYLKDYLHHWKSDQVGRSEASPHIKTYFRASPDYEKIAWFLVTSANLSKAAWGALEKKDSQFMIRSYELGVLFLPEYFGNIYFCLPSGYTKNDIVPFLIPFDLPLSKYGVKDEPWIWDIPHVYGPDRYGNKWCPS